LIHNEFYGLIGVFGERSKQILMDILKKNQIDTTDIKNYANASFHVSQNPILKYPVYVDLGEKSLILFGNCFLKDATGSEFLNSPSLHLERVVGEKRNEMPLAFVNGAYIGVILDRANYSIFNDFFGLQPLYYYRNSGHFIISTRLSVLARYFDPELDKEALTEFLMLQRLLSGKTIIKGIFSLPPASCINISYGGEVKIDNYVTYPPDNLLSAKLEDIAEEILGAFKISIRRIYSDSLKYCMTLTGGSDTRLLFLEWPEKESLLTDTAGFPDTSDVLKAKELVKKYGNPSLHALEELHKEKYFEGFKKFYDLLDNPLNVLQNFNYYHLQSILSRGADMRMYGSGELLGGENLYLSRSPSYLLKEMFLPYKYHALEKSKKSDLLKGVLKVKLKQGLGGLLKKDLQKSIEIDNVLIKLAPYLGEAKYQETFTERFRTTVVALAGYVSFGEIIKGNAIFISPYYDREFVETVLKYHPTYRGLRRLQIYILRKYHKYDDIPLDTTHLRVRAPYYFHKLARVPRHVLNIGLHKKVPFIQRGNPPSYRKNPYLEPSNTEFRKFIQDIIRNAEIFDNDQLDEYFEQIDSVKEFTFYTRHRELTNIYLLFRAAYAVKKLNLKV
jgi:asparagine synthetase B (glutamine-hydrolysing)